jgi:CheY-like chemotaxis protein
MAGAKKFGTWTDDGAAGDAASDRPLVDEPAASDSKLRAGPSVRPARSGRVLVVDDEAAVGRTIQRLLGDRHDVVVVTSGTQAVEMLAAGDDFDVILCDMSMPEVTGMDVYSRATSNRPEIAMRFVFMTGGSFHPRTREFLEQSRNARIDKPFDLTALRTLVRDRIASER